MQWDTYGELSVYGIPKKEIGITRKNVTLYGEKATGKKSFKKVPSRNDLIWRKYYQLVFNQIPCFESVMRLCKSYNWFDLNVSWSLSKCSLWNLGPLCISNSSKAPLNMPLLMLYFLQIPLYVELYDSILNKKLKGNLQDMWELSGSAVDVGQPM